MKLLCLSSGKYFLILRNQLATIINYPKDGLPHKAVAMHLSTKRLRAFYNDNLIKSKAVTEKLSVLRNILYWLLVSLIPIWIQHNFPENIASLKITEAINILRTIYSNIDFVLQYFRRTWQDWFGRFYGKVNMPLENSYQRTEVWQLLNAIFRKRLILRLNDGWLKSVWN